MLTNFSVLHSALYLILQREQANLLQEIKRLFTPSPEDRLLNVPLFWMCVNAFKSLKRQLFLETRAIWIELHRCLQS